MSSHPTRVEDTSARDNWRRVGQISRSAFPLEKYLFRPPTEKRQRLLYRRPMGT